MKICVELDSDLHKEDKDEIRDAYLFNALGITTFRMRGFEKESVQKSKFQELTALLRSKTPQSRPEIFAFGENIRLEKGV